MKFRITVALFIAIFFSASPAFAEKAPSLDLRTMQGEVEDLDHWVGKGKWVLVMFWELDCHYCELNKPAIIEFHRKHKDNDAVVVGVSLDGMAEVEAIKSKLKETPLGFPNYVGEKGVLAINYLQAAGEELVGTPSYWLFTPKGELKAVQRGILKAEAVESYIAKFAQR